MNLDDTIAFARMGIPEKRANALIDVSDERNRQLAKWGPQSHPDGTNDGSYFVDLANYHRAVCENGAKMGPAYDSWWNILLEETYEAGAEIDWPALRKELVQSAAVIVAWIEDGDQRG